MVANGQDVLESPGGRQAAAQAARAELYGLLSGAFARELTQDAWVRLCSDETRASLVELAVACGVGDEAGPLLQCLTSSRDLDPGTTVEEMAVDYARLFIGPGPGLAPPYESVYTSPERRFYGEALGDVTTWLRTEGVRVGDEFHAPADHIAVELAIMQHLALESAEQLAAGDAPEALAKRLKFLDRHLRRWVPEWVVDVRAGAATAFYREAASLLDEYLQRDEAWLRHAMHVPRRAAF